MAPRGGYWNGEIGVAPRPLRFGPDLDYRPAAEQMREAQENAALERLIRETMDRLRRPLWFWEIQNG